MTRAEGAEGEGSRGSQGPHMPTIIVARVARDEAGGSSWYVKPFYTLSWLGRKELVEQRFRIPALMSQPLFVLK